MHPQKITGLADIYLEFEELPDPCRPCLVVRAEGATLITIDPRTTRIESTSWCLENLTAAEVDAYREAFGAPPAGEGAGPDSWTDDEPVHLYVPPDLRLRSASPAQPHQGMMRRST